MVSKEASAIIEKYMGKYMDSAIILHIAINQMLYDGVRYYAELTQEQMDQIVEEKQKPVPEEVRVDENGKEHRVRHVKLTTKELDQDIIAMQHELAQLKENEVAQIIAYMNGDQNIHEQQIEQLKNIIDEMRNLLKEKRMMVSDEQILDAVGMDREEFMELTGIEMEEENAYSY